MATRGECYVYRLHLQIKIESSERCPNNHQLARGNGTSRWPDWKQGHGRTDQTRGKCEGATTSCCVSSDLNPPCACADGGHPEGGTMGGLAFRRSMSVLLAPLPQAAWPPPNHPCLGHLESLAAGLAQPGQARQSMSFRARARKTRYRVGILKPRLFCGTRGVLLKTAPITPAQVPPRYGSP